MQTVNANSTTFVPASMAGAAEDAMPLSDSDRQTRFLERADGRIAYDDTGKGPLVVLVPGLGDLRQSYRTLAPVLTGAGYRVVRMDLRGHGESSVGWPAHGNADLGRDVLALIEHLGAGPAIVVGTSMGAGAAAWAAAERPDAISRLVLISPFVRDVPRSAAATAAQNLAVAVLLRGPWAASAWGMLYKGFHHAPPPDLAAYRQTLVANLAEPGRIAALRGMIAAPKADVAARLHEVRAPVLVVMGAADGDFPDPAAEAETVARLLRGTAQMIPDAGHYPQVEAPAATAAAILPFLRSQAGA